MPQQFRFTATDPVVTAGLSAQAIQDVAQWQDERLDYRFEFHTMHTAGWPCYLREPDSRRNLPKINIRTESYTGAFLQSESVRTRQCGEDFAAVVRANVEAIRTLAQRFYEGVDAEPMVTPTSWYVQFTCTKKGSKAKPVYIRLPDNAQVIGPVFWSNMRNLAQKPLCPVHKSQDCLDGEPVEVGADIGAKVDLTYDSRFDIVER